MSKNSAGWYRSHQGSTRGKVQKDFEARLLLPRTRYGISSESGELDVYQPIGATPAKSSCAADGMFVIFLGTPTSSPTPAVRSWTTSRWRLRSRAELRGRSANR